VEWPCFNKLNLPQEEIVVVLLVYVISYSIFPFSNKRDGLTAFMFTSLNLVNKKKTHFPLPGVDQS